MKYNHLPLFIIANHAHEFLKQKTNCNVTSLEEKKMLKYSYQAKILLKNNKNKLNST